MFIPLVLSSGLKLLAFALHEDSRLKQATARSGELLQNAAGVLFFVLFLMEKW